MTLGKGKKRLLAGFGFLIAGLLIIWFSTPVWFPWVFRPLGGKIGLHFARYERNGLSHFTLHDASFTNADIHIHVEKAQGLVPNVWLWRQLQGQTKEPFAQVEGWQLHFPASPPQTNSPSVSVHTIVTDVVDALGMVRRWLPKAVVSNGKIDVGNTNLEIHSVTWDHGNVSGKMRWPQFQHEAIVHAALNGPLPYSVNVSSDTMQLQSSILISSTAGGLKLQSTNWWRTNEIELQADFGRNGVLPEQAKLTAQRFALPGKLLQIPEYREVRGAGEVAWARGEFTLNVQADAEPQTLETNLPAARLDLKARGNTNSAVIESATVSSPWLQAEVSKDLKVNFHGPPLPAGGTIKLAADLTHQPWIHLHGILAGEAKFDPMNEKFPEATFHLQGTNMGSAQLDAKAFFIEGKLRWPVVEISQATGTFDDNSRATVKGKYDVAAKTISDAHLDFSGPLAGRWLPAGLGHDNATLSADFSGPLGKLTHQGRLIVTNFVTPQTKVVQAVLNWSGEDMSFRHADISIQSDDARLEASGKVELSGTNRFAPTEVSVQLEKLNLQALKETQTQTHLEISGATITNKSLAAMELVKPSTITVNWGGTNGLSGTIHDFHWRGTGGDILAEAGIDWPRRGNFSVTITNSHTRILDSFLAGSMEPIEVRSFVGAASWTNGPLTFQLEASARDEITNNQYASTAGEAIVAEARLAGNGSGIWISNLVVTSETSRVAEARGFLPITIQPKNPTNIVQLEMAKPVEFTARTEPNAVFWQKLAERTGIILTEPKLQADVAGTWSAPNGRIQLQAVKIQLPKTNFALPTLEKLSLDLALNRQQAILTNFNLLIQGQPVKGTVQMPLGDEFWNDIRAKKIPRWEKASGHIAVENAQISAFAGLFPTILAPQGEFSLDAALTPGGNLSGDLNIHHGRTRPLANMGTIRDIEIGMSFSGRTIKLKSSTIAIGGSTVMVAGEGDLSGTDWLKGKAPPFEFVLLGTNVPLSRQPESIIRADLNLAVRKTNGAPALISGTARLRNSYYLSDIADLVPGQVSSPDRRPPYFSIDEPELGDWRLAIRVNGDRGMRVRSTLFTGQVTPNLRLQGTLREPMAIGDVRIDSGTVIFPFADLDVQQGYITLASVDPYRPHLMITASSRKFGYEVKMEMTGPADQPLIQFSSTPPLSSDQLVLIVTAGELPRGGYNLNPQQRAETMALFLGKDLLRKLGIGDQSEDRLNFSSGQDITETGKPTYTLEYKLNDRWSLVGEYDRFNAFNAGVKWKLYSK